MRDLRVGKCVDHMTKKVICSSPSSSHSSSSSSHSIVDRRSRSLAIFSSQSAHQYGNRYKASACSLGRKDRSTQLCLPQSLSCSRQNLCRRNEQDSRSRSRVISNVIPSYGSGSRASTPPDLPSYLFANRIVYLGMALVPSVTELILAELLWLNMEDPKKPVTMYINSTGITKEGRKLAYDTEAMAIYDTMQYVRTPISTVAVGNAWGEAGMLLAAGTKGRRAALPSASIMIRQPQGGARGQATDIDIYRREARRTRGQVLDILSKHTGKAVDVLDKDTNRPLYMSPQDAVNYGIIDKVRHTRLWRGRHRETKEPTCFVTGDLLTKGQLSRLNYVIYYFTGAEDRGRS